MSLDPTELPMESRNALRYAALLGTQFSLLILQEAGVSDESLDVLFDRGVFEPTGASMARFVSQEFFQRALEEIPWSQRRKASATLARLAVKHRCEERDIARLFLGAQEFGEARRHLIEAARESCAQKRYHQALEALRQCFEIWPPEEEVEQRTRALKEMARCAANTGDWESGRVAWEELLAIGEAGDDVALQLEANQSLADLANQRRDRLEMKMRLRRAAELGSDGGDLLQGATLWQNYAQFLLDNVRLKDCIEACGKASEAAEAANAVGLVVEIKALSGLAHAMSGQTTAGRTLVDEALRMAVDNDLPDKLAIAYRRMANVNEYSCEYASYLEMETESLNRCRARGDRGMEQACLSCLSYAFFRMGHWKQSLDAVKTAIDEVGVDGELLAVASSVRASITAFRGERKQAKEGAEEALRLIDSFGGIVLEFYVHWSKGYLAMMDGETEAAVEAFRDLIELWRETDDRKDSVPGLMTAAMFFTDQNDSQSLAECVDILNTIAAENQALEIRAARSAALAESAWLRGKLQEAIELGTEAMDAYKKQGLPPEQALVARRLGLMHASGGNLKEAEACWRRAAETARGLGMRPMLDLIERDRRSTGAVEVSLSSAKKAGLTRRQIDVLRLIAAGDTNKEAAAKLNLSPRTVEMHVASVLERLNCRGRAEAVKKAAGLGLV